MPDSAPGKAQPWTYTLTGGWDTVVLQGIWGFWLSEGHCPSLFCTASASLGALGELLGIAEHKGHKTMGVCPKESTGRGPQERSYSTKIAGVQEAFRQHSR